jgi:hypothetical protein
MNGVFWLSIMTYRRGIKMLNYINSKIKEIPCVLAHAVSLRPND